MKMHNFAVWKVAWKIVTATKPGDNPNPPVNQPAHHDVVREFVTDVPKGISVSTILKKLEPLAENEKSGFENEWPLEVSTAFTGDSVRRRKFSDL